MNASLRVRRALDATCPIAPLDPELSKALFPDPLLLKAAEPAIRAFRDTFVLQPVEKDAKKKEKRKFAMYDDQPDIDPDLLAAKRLNAADHSAGAAFDAMQPTVEHVGSVTPMEDFRAMLKRRDDVAVWKRAWEEMKTLIERLVEDSYGDSMYGRAMECVRGLRAAAVGEGEADLFNTWMEGVREKWRRGREGWWTKLKAEGMRLIDDSEVGDSKVSRAEADRWSEDVDDSSRVRSESLPVSADDERDIFDELE